MRHVTVCRFSVYWEPNTGLLCTAVLGDHGTAIRISQIREELEKRNVAVNWDKTAHFEKLVGQATEEMHGSAKGMR